MENQEVDTALILENELQRRVTQVINSMLPQMVSEAMSKRFAKEKADMMMEISIKLGQMLRGMTAEDRRPLWETEPTEFGAPARKEVEGRGHMSRITKD